MKLKNIFLVIGLLGVGYYGFTLLKKKKTKTIQDGSFTIEVEDIGEKPLTEQTEL